VTITITAASQVIKKIDWSGGVIFYV